MERKKSLVIPLENRRYGYKIVPGCMCFVEIKSWTWELCGLSQCLKDTTCFPSQDGCKVKLLDPRDHGTLAEKYFATFFLNLEAAKFSASPSTSQSWFYVRRPIFQYIHKFLLCLLRPRQRGWGRRCKTKRSSSKGGCDSEIVIERKERQTSRLARPILPSATCLWLPLLSMGLVCACELKTKVGCV